MASLQRTALAPDVPAIAETLPGFEAVSWVGIVAPAGTPPAIVEKIGDDVRALLKTPAFAEKQVTSKGLDVVASSSKELAATIKEESVTVGEMIRAAGVQPE